MKRAGIRIFIIFVMVFTIVFPVDASGISQIEGGREDDEIKLLFIGNSLTYYRAKGKDNYFLAYFTKMAENAGHDMSVSWVTKSGQNLSNWANEKKSDGKRAYRAIRREDWDYVILQENTDYATANNSSFQKAAKKLSRAIYKNCPDTQVVYNCTWAYQKGKRLRGKFYSYFKMQKLLNQHYAQAARVTKGKVSWAGSSFYSCKKEDKTINLYVKDNNHPSRYGAYLSACSMYAAIFKDSPTKYNFQFVGSKKNARQLQSIAARVNHIRTK